jgi:hypothetical protein
MQQDDMRAVGGSCLGTADLQDTGVDLLECAEGCLRRLSAHETWSVLRAEFTDATATHSTCRIFSSATICCCADIAGGFAAAQFVHDYIIADGIRLPSKDAPNFAAPIAFPISTH